jgi:cell division protein FtsI/penicillin-binding protein 2
MRSGRLRLFAVMGVMVCFWVGLWLKIFYIQIINNNAYATKIKKQAERRVIIQPKRGLILDRYGVVLAENRGRDAAMEPDGEHGINVTGKRVYPKGRLAAQLLGFVGRDGDGLSGIEYYFDRWLKGTPGWAIVKCDGKQSLNPVAELVNNGKNPLDGYTIQLTVDAEIQSIAEDALARGMERTGARHGAIIILNPGTGEVLAIANAPFFNANRFKGGKGHEWINYAISRIYEPGSTFKLVTLTAALEEGVVQEKDMLDAGNGKLVIYGQTIHDSHSYERLSVRDAWIHSSNVCLARIAKKMGRTNMYTYARSFGMGSKTGIALPGEESGILNPLNQWSGRTLVTMAMGHEISVTGIQMAMSYAAVANDGILMKPQIVKAIYRGRDTVLALSRVIVRRVVSPETAERMQSLLVHAVERGTGTLARINGYTVGGKTGTAQKIDPESGGYIPNRFVSSFAGVVPMENPMIVCYVILDEPVSPYSGGKAAAPVFHDVLTQIIQSPNLSYGYEFSKYKNGGAPEKGVNPGIQTEIVQKSANSGVQKNTAVSKEGGAARLKSFPRLKGLSMRKALERLNELDIEVVVEGHGYVKKQYPVCGTPLKKVRICRLVGS